MATDILILANGLLHRDNAAAAMSASSTQNSYAVDNAREADLQQAWKPLDSTNDESLVGDTGAAANLGAIGAAAWCAVSYDSRVADQTAIKLQYGTTDDGAFAVPVDVPGAAWTISGANALAMSPVFLQFAVPNPQKRYYRLFQDKTLRSGGLTRTAKIFHFELYPLTGVISVPLINPGNSEAAYAISQMSRVASMRTPGGYPRTNRYAKPGYRFEVNFGPASDTLWQAARDQFDAIGGMHRAVYVAKEGLKNTAQPNSFMCRLTNPDWDASLNVRGNYHMKLQFDTECWQ